MNVVHSNKFIFLFCLCFLSACDLWPGSLNVTVNFSDGRGIKAEDAVEFKGIQIGKVSAVSVIPAGVTVALKLEKSKAAEVQSNALAAIADENAAKKIVLTNPPEASPPVADGAVLVALEPKTGLGALLGTLSKIQETVQQVAKTAGDYFTGANAQWQDSKKKMDETWSSLQQLTDASKDQLLTHYQAFIQEIEASSGQVEQQSKKVLDDYTALEQELMQKQQAYTEEGKAKAAEAIQTLRGELKTVMDKFKKGGSEAPVDKSFR